MSQLATSAGEDEVANAAIPITPGAGAVPAFWPGAAGLALLMGGLACLVVEAIVAAGWKSPGYSYIHDKIAYLGSPYCGRFEGTFSCSPYWQAMLVTWLVNGLLVLVAGLVLGHMIGGRSGVTIRAVAVAEAAGFALFALFHDSPGAQADGTIIGYFSGAALVLIAGGTLAIIVGRANRRLGLARWLGPVSVALGAASLLAAVVTLGWAPIGLAERISVYAILAWQLLLGGQLLTRSVLTWDRHVRFRPGTFCARQAKVRLVNLRPTAAGGTDGAMKDMISSWK